MTMVLVDAVRNVVRGAEQAVGSDNDLVTRFNERHPKLKTLHATRSSTMRITSVAPATPSGRVGGVRASHWRLMAPGSKSQRPRAALLKATSYGS